MTPEEIVDQRSEDSDVVSIIRHLVQEHYGNLYDGTLQRMIYSLHALYTSNATLTQTKQHLAYIDKQQRRSVARVGKDEEPDLLLGDMDFHIGDRVATLTGACPGTVVESVNWSPEGMVHVHWEHMEGHEACWQTNYTHMRPGQLRKIKD
ncbi:MAG TPA: hypothetical protein VH084_29935 [Mycobacterium sp.]|jgi:hypothetical protein|nr:hypothetical protein [Mycobacterium sp.]